VHSLVYIASTESYTFDSVSPIIFSHRQQLSLVNPQFASDVVHLFPVITTRSFIEGDHLRRHSTSYNHVPSPSTLSSLSLGLKTEGIFPVFPAPFSTFYHPISVFSENPKSGRNLGWRLPEYGRK
jgi:hypothetical protein